MRLPFQTAHAAQTAHAMAAIAVKIDIYRMVFSMEKNELILAKKTMPT